MKKKLLQSLPILALSGCQAGTAQTDIPVKLTSDSLNEIAYEVETNSENIERVLNELSVMNKTLQISVVNEMWPYILVVGLVLVIIGFFCLRLVRLFVRREANEANTIQLEKIASIVKNGGRKGKGS